MANPAQPQPTHSPPGDHHQQHDNWENEEMFNIYIYDYCTKRGYNKTARSLEEEAGLSSENRRPPIDAKQGLLYEWWSVFWVLFSAKTNSQGNDDAMLYIQHQQQLAQARGMIGRGPLPNGIRPALPGGPPMPNGIHAGPPPHGHMMPPPMPANAAQQQPGHGPQPTGQPPLGFPAAVQTNGARPGQPPPPQQPGMPAQPGQQTPGGPPRGPAGGFPGPSPALAHAQTPQQQHQQPQQPQPQGPQPYPPVNVAGTPGGMFPPGGMPPHMRGMPNGIIPPPQFVPGAGGAVPAGSSRAPTPAGPNGALTQPSPSLMHRTIPQPAGGPTFGGAVQQPAPPPGAARGPPFESMLSELSKIDSQTMHELRSELNLGNKNVTQMTLDEQQRVMGLFRQRQAGPSGAQGQHVQTLGRPAKRASVSPEGEQLDSKIETSPNSGQKRMRRSPPDGGSPAQPQGSGPGPGPGAPTLGGPSGQMQPPPPPGAQAPPMYPMIPGGLAGGMRPPFATSGMPGGPMSGISLQQPGQPGQAMHPGTVPAQMTAQLTQMQQFGQQKPGQPFHPGMMKMDQTGPPFAPDGSQPRSGPPSFAPGNAAALSAAAVMTPRPPGSAGGPQGPPGSQPGQMGPMSQLKPGQGPNMMPPPPSPASGVGAKGAQQQPGPGQQQQPGKMSPPKADTSPRGAPTQAGGPSQPPPSGGNASTPAPPPLSGPSGPPGAPMGMMSAPSPGMMQGGGSRPQTANSVGAPQQPQSAGTSGSTPATPGMRPAQPPTPQQQQSQPPQSTPQPQPTPQPPAPPNSVVNGTGGAPGAPGGGPLAGGLGSMDDSAGMFNDFMSNSGFDDFTAMFGRDDEFSNMDWLNDFGTQ